MTSETTPGAFGEVLEELMRARNLEPSPENIRRLADASGLDTDGLLRSMIAESAEDLGYLDRLADELVLSHEEMAILALAYTFGTRTAAAARGAASESFRHEAKDRAEGEGA